MPRLILFVPAERVIIDDQDRSLSLISIMSGVKIQLVRPNEQPAPGTAVPLRWSVLSLWKQESNDEGKSFEQRLQLFMPDGSVPFDLTTPFNMREQNYRIRNDVFGFVVSTPGLCRLVVSLREVGHDAWTEFSAYEMLLEHVLPEASL